MAASSSANLGGVSKKRHCMPPYPTRLSRLPCILQADRLAEDLLAQHGCIDVLVNASGAYPDSGKIDPLEGHPDAWETAFRRAFSRGRAGQRRMQTNLLVRLADGCTCWLTMQSSARQQFCSCHPPCRVIPHAVLQPECAGAHAPDPQPGPSNGRQRCACLLPMHRVRWVLRSAA